MDLCHVNLYLEQIWFAAVVTSRETLLCCLESIHCRSNLEAGNSQEKELLAARYTTNRYYNTSSMTVMLNHPQCESRESRGMAIWKILCLLI